MRRRSIPLLALAAALGLASSSCVKQPPPEEPSRIAVGRDMYRRYCASCHGVEGGGDGPVGAVLTQPPTDLTRISARLGGNFPHDEIASYIDGRAWVPAHGSREMPVWGRRFDDRTQSAFAEETRLLPYDILAIVEYLETIQRAEVD